ncbi:claudin-4-like [Mugil cephalus]|uniref:claudin-4-like n=1 Tax=Mugil cephalus TaxID=48193 RepID=UPI001FB68979|nr:claudin-4-like [Mugil cephalus]
MSWCTMASVRVELTGISLSVLGWVLSVISCALPMWRVSTTDGYDTDTIQTLWEGLWMRCVAQSAGQMQCEDYQSWLYLPQELQVTKGLAIAAVFVGAVALLITMVGAKCTAWIETEWLRARVLGSSGGVFITAALIQCASVLCIALVTSGENNQKNGAALYLGAVSSILLLIGGLVLCTRCPSYKDKPKSRDETKRYNTYPQTCVIYSATPSSTAQRSHHKND